MKFKYLFGDIFIDILNIYGDIHKFMDKINKKELEKSTCAYYMFVTLIL